MDKAIVTRFWAKVDKRGADECWLWTAAVDRKGYGKMFVAGRLAGAHRISFEIENGPFRRELHVCHRCDTPACVNPTHLFLGTHSDNMRDMDAKGRRGLAGFAGPVWQRPAWRDGRCAGEKNPKARLNSDQAMAIYKRRRSGEMLRVLAEEYGVTTSQIWAIANGVTWKHVTQRS